MCDNVYLGVACVMGCLDGQLSVCVSLTEGISESPFPNVMLVHLCRDREAMGIQRVRLGCEKRSCCLVLGEREFDW